MRYPVLGQSTCLTDVQNLCEVHIVATNNTRRRRGLNLSLGTNPDNDTYVANTSPKHESIVKP